MSTLSDDDLWEILECKPNSETMPSDYWIAGVKQALSGSYRNVHDPLQFFCLCLSCALDFYSKYAPHSDAWQGDDHGLCVKRTVVIFENALTESGVDSDLVTITVNPHEYCKVEQVVDAAAEKNLVTMKTIRGQWGRDGTYCKLTRKGRKWASDFGDNHVLLNEETNHQHQYQSNQLAANLTAQATGGNAIAAPVVNAAPVAKIGDVQQKVTLNTSNPAETVTATSDAIERARDKAREEGIEHGRLLERVEQAKTGGVPPPPPNGVPDVEGHTAKSLMDFVNKHSSLGISESTARGILNPDHFIGRQKRGKNWVDIYDFEKSEKAALDYIKTKEANT